VSEERAHRARREASRSRRKLRCLRGREGNLRPCSTVRRVSENGPREGTRDLPRPGPDAGHRAVDEDSVAGAAYGILSRSLRRRRAELVALVDSGGSLETVAATYLARHPLEPRVTPAEIQAAVAETTRRVSGSGRVPVRVSAKQGRPK
jgi:hypothetical protein